MAKNRQRGNFEHGQKLAQQSLEACFRKRAGEAIVAASIQEIIRVVPCNNGISADAMVGALQKMKREGLIKVKTKRPDGPTRIKLRPSGRTKLDQ